MRLRRIPKSPVLQVVLDMMLLRFTVVGFRVSLGMFIVRSRVDGVQFHPGFGPKMFIMLLTTGVPDNNRFNVARPEP